MSARPRSTRCAPLGVLLFTATVGPTAAGELDLQGFVSGRAVVVEGIRAWIDGGFGRMTEGAREGFTTVTGLRAEAQLALDWEASAVVRLHLQGRARTEPGAAGGWRAGLDEGFLQYRPEFTASTALRLRAGLFFPATSRENVEPLWQSPYTITLSAVNAWIGEELRLAGVEAALQLGGGDHRVELAGVAFGGSDTAGALLSWRGWAMGERLSVVGEVLPLPPLPTLEPGGGFGDQRADGTRPVDELDGRLGWQARLRWAREGSGLLQAAFTDTRGDRGLHRGQYAWATRFVSLGAELPLGARLRVVAEGLLGETGMGPKLPGGPFVDVRFRAGYALASWVSRGGRWRLSVRYDRFHNEDFDGTAEPDDDSGYAWTLAAFFSPSKAVRIGLEWLSLSADRPAAVEAGGAPVDTGGRRAQAELRIRF